MKRHALEKMKKVDDDFLRGEKQSIIFRIDYTVSSKTS